MRSTSLPTRACTVALSALLTTWATAQRSPSYSRDVRPILSEACFACHGPDQDARKAELRLDVPGHDLGRELLRRVTAADPDEVMPPPHTGKSLTEAQVATLRAWVDGGAPYETHWAFVRPTRPALPRPLCLTCGVCGCRGYFILISAVACRVTSGRAAPDGCGAGRCGARV